MYDSWLLYLLIRAVAQTIMSTVSVVLITYIFLSESRISRISDLDRQRNALRGMSNTKERAWPHFQTPRRELKNTTHSEVFLTKLEMFGNIVKHLSWVFDTFSQSKLKLRRKQRTRSVKIYANYEYMKDHIFEQRRKIWIYGWSSQLYTQLQQLWN